LLLCNLVGDDALALSECTGCGPAGAWLGKIWEEEMLKPSKRRSLGIALFVGCAASGLALSCSSGGGEEPSTEAQLAAFDLTSIPTDQASLMAATLEFNKAFNVDQKNPKVLARKDQLNEINDRLANVVETIEVEPGHVVKLYEPTPGARMVSETYQKDQTRVMKTIAATSFADVFRALKPNSEVPSSLVETDLRAADATLMVAPSPEIEQLPPAPAAEPQVDKHGTSDCSHFKFDHGGCPIGESADPDACFCNNVGISRAFANAATHSAWLVSAYVGSVSFEFKYNGTAYSTVAIAPGEFYGIQWRSGSGNGNDPSCPGCSAWVASCATWTYCRREHRGTIVAVEPGDSYHFGGCTETDYNSPWECF
jgi:hypothetical protein